MRVTSRDVNLYLNWVLYSVYGRMAVADQLLREHRRPIHGVARAVGARHRVPGATLFRGVLLDPGLVVDGTVACHEEVESVSFSAHERVARWFADPASVISTFVSQQQPLARGYVVRHAPDPDQVLFHHQWPVASMLRDLAVMHPDVDEEQFCWNLDTQAEVIVKPHPTPLPAEPCSPEAWETRALDDLLCQPSILERRRKLLTPGLVPVE